MSDTYKIIDLSYLQSMGGGDELVNQLLTIYLDQIPEFVDGMEISLRERFWYKLNAVAHKAKNSVIALGMNQVGDDLKKIQLLCEVFARHEYEDKLKNNTLSEEEKVYLDRLKGKTLDTDLGMPEEEKNILLDEFKAFKSNGYSNYVEQLTNNAVATIMESKLEVESALQ